MLTDPLMKQVFTMATDVTADPQTPEAAPAVSTIEVNQPGDAASVMLTERAATEIKRVMSENGVSEESSCVRVGVRGGGCSGFQYSFGFDDTTDSAQDFVSEQHGIKVAVNKMEELHLAGMEVDFYEDLDRRGFVFNHPNVTNSCGCGSSFSA